MRRRLLLTLLPALALGLGCKQQQPDEAALVLATTTSTYDTGLLDALVPPFEQAHQIQVKVVAVGTGEALEMGRRGIADVMMVHAPAAELEVVSEGHAIDRRPMMWNDFVIVGPADDPAKIAGGNAAAAFARLAAAEATFVSRGDNSGTNKKELKLLRATQTEPGWPGYLESGQGMGFTMRIADEKQGYTLTDRGTYLALKDSIGLRILVEGDPELANPYHVMRLNPQKHPATNVELATAMLDYFVSDDVAKRVETFGVEKYGQPLFHPGTL